MDIDLPLPIMQGWKFENGGGCDLRVRNTRNPDRVAMKLLRQRWCHLCLKDDGLEEVLTVVGKPKKKVNWLKFLGLAAGTMSESMEHTFRILCLVMSQVPGKDSIPVDVFNAVYEFMAQLDEVDPGHVSSVVSEMATKANRQNGKLYFTNFDLTSGAGCALTPDSVA
ncbi:unnamed protein product [Notodromas monacha]|uniref:Uncharacterized protein n=1 Tax=Notodromas monacha TaxID=399045 RepID=A0A7R9GJ55_9CRUS|nr:unnamed protein product [Notodromas monacha]CAG0923166.1 unnamed protein product [Notodromas monacha]